MMYNKFCHVIIVCLTICCIPCAAFSECWDVSEISQLAFDELDGAIVFSFKDAVSCLPVTEAIVNINNQTLTTDAGGYVKLPNAYFESIMDGTAHIKATKDGYCTFEDNIQVMVGTVINKRFLMSKRLPIGKARFILQWEERPKDLDLHLVGKDFHISYRNMKVAAQKAILDRDDVNSYGPETITLDNIVPSDTYGVYVHNYSGETPISSDAQVSVYKDNQLDKIIHLPDTKKPYVKILEIRNSEIRFINVGVHSIQH